MLKEKNFNFHIPNNKVNPVDPEQLIHEKMNCEQEDYYKKRSTLLMLSREIGVDKQKIYRYIKKNNIPTLKENDTIYIDDTVKRQIITVFSQNSDVVKKHSKHESRSTSIDKSNGASKITSKQFEMIVKILKNELQEKDKQIADLIKIIDQKNRDSQS